MGDAEGFVEVQVGDISPIVTRSAESYLGIHVGTVKVHLTTVVMGDVTDLSSLKERGLAQNNGHIRSIVVVITLY